ncbi:MAG TPA: CoA-binding protein [Acidimicrobiia bacterium]|nr:CoA-binding protein [Acidimicrobiia bacterium]
MDQYDLLADRRNLIAVVGATDSPGKYGGIIYRDLRGRGHRVVAVNPRRSNVAGDPSYPDLTSLPERPDIVNLVVPPTAGRSVVAEWAQLGGASVWFQPGASDADLVSRARDAGMDVIDGDCIMVLSRRLAS